MLVEDGTVMGAVRFLVQYFEGLFVQGCLLLLVCPQLVRQYVRCDMIMAFMYNLAEFNVIVFLCI